MKLAPSLRLRLTLIILLPILAIAVLAGLWELSVARKTAADIFDRGLLSAALAVSNDVAISGGDALSRRTRDILADTSGGRVFYNVYGPDGVIVAGYATPPVGIPRSTAEPLEPIFFEARYLGDTVSGVRWQSQTELDGFTGLFTTTVWQKSALRQAFVRDLVLRSLTTILALIASLCLVVWFGVRLGLRPLNDIEAAIARRSSADLSSIQRPVPVEVSGIVRTLNDLFGQVSRSMTAQAEFIGNAAHQLRNPIAGVLSLAEAVERAPNAEAARRRAKDMLTAARETADLSNQLLLYERAQSMTPAGMRQPLDLDAALPDWVEDMRAGHPGLDLRLHISGSLGHIEADALMLREALRNLVDNARRHAGPGLSRVEVSALRDASGVTIVVADDGQGIAPRAMSAAFDRFKTVSDTGGSGLGLAIVREVVERHGGGVRLADHKPGLSVTLHLPD